MSFLSQACVGHGQASTDAAAACCPGYKKWNYDANNGIGYQGFMCWTALCAGEGQWAGPGGQGNNCCTGLVNSGGKCAVPVPGSGGPITPLPPVIVPTVCEGTIICDIPDMWIYGGVAGLVLLFAMGGKK